MYAVLFDSPTIYFTGTVKATFCLGVLPWLLLADAVLLFAVTPVLAPGLCGFLLMSGVGLPTALLREKSVLFALRVFHSSFVGW